jgi:CheY-like chemotaxis protein
MTTVLVIDDEAPIRLLCRVNLEAEGMAVLEASDGPSGLEAAKAKRPDLILLDVMMPQVDGWEMLRRVQERHGVGSIPVLMFSGKVDERSADDAQDRGASGFIGKPFDPQQLIESAKQMLPT